MALKDKWVDKVDGVDIASAEDINQVAGAVIELENEVESGGGNGKDGFSPIVSVEKIDGGNRVVITDAKGDNTFDVMDGADGQDGQDGVDGKDGTSVTVESVNESTEDGGSNVVKFSDGKTVTIKNGSKGSTGATGAAGADGKDYVLTEADKTEIATKVVEMLGGNPIFGIVDENNNIILSGNLADGDYTVKYEMEDGSKVDIGNLVLDTNVYYSVTNNLTNCANSNSAITAVEGESYSATITANDGYELSSVSVTMGGSPVSVSGGIINISNVTGNIVITAVATEVQTNDTDNILTNGAYTIEMNKRWSNSSKSYRACDGMICITIPAADALNKTIYFKGFTKDLQASSSKPIWLALDADLAKVGSVIGGESGDIWTGKGLTDEGNGVYSYLVNDTNFEKVSSATYLKLNMAVNASAAVTSLDGLTMTIDKPIS